MNNKQIAWIMVWRANRPPKDPIQVTPFRLTIPRVGAFNTLVFWSPTEKHYEMEFGVLTQDDQPDTYTLIETTKAVRSIKRAAEAYGIHKVRGLLTEAEAVQQQVALKPFLPTVVPKTRDA